MNIIIKKAMILFLAFGFFQCKEEVNSDPTPLPVNGALETSALLYEVSLEDLKNLAQIMGQSEMADQLKFGISAYKIEYITSYKEEPVLASGVMYVPKGIKDPAPLLSLHHGTTFVKNDVPSAGTFSGMEYFAAGGYITMMPDFLGYGSSSEVFHPYYDQKYSATAVIDMIKAGKHFLIKNEIVDNGHLFLAGYSEGGYVTMAAAKEIELNHEHNLQVTAIAAGAGGYDLSEMLEMIKTNNHYPYPAYLAFIIMSYNETYNWGLPLDYYFQKEYANLLPDLMNGTKNGDQINAKLTTDLNDLFNTEFYERIKNGSEVNFQSALIQNSVGLDSWYPKAPTRLFHGTSDQIVPFSNSEMVFQNLVNKGAQDIDLIPIPGGTHSSSVLPMIRALVPWFESILQGS